MDSGGALTGCERMPAALRAAGLPDAVPVDELGDLPVSLTDPVRNSATGVIGVQALVSASAVGRDA